MRTVFWSAAALMLFAACDRAEKEWSAAAKANTIAGYERFLTEHPDSEHAADAEARIEALSRRAAFDSALRTGTEEALERILARYPTDPAAGQVRRKLDALRYDAAAARHSIRGWETFLREYPQSPFAESGRRQLQAILDERRPEFRDVRTVRIEIAEDYGEAGGVKLPFERVASEILPHAGVQVVPGEADAVLAFRSTGEPHGASYTTLQFGVGGPGRFLYTGVQFSGSVTLRNGAGSLTVPFRHDIEVPHSTTGGSASPDHAPFEKAFSASVPFATRLLIGRAFGPNPLLAEISSGERWLDSAAVRAAGALRPPPTGRLIEMLRREQRPSSRFVLVAALGETREVDAVRPLLDAVRGDASLRAVTAEALEKIGAPAVPLLLQSVSDRTLPDDVLICAVEALGRTGDERAAGPLIARLPGAKTDALRCAIARALASMDDRSALLAVARLLADGNAAVRTCSARSLTNEFEKQPVWGVPAPHVREFLEGNGDPKLIEALLRGLDSGAGSYEVESAVLSMLAAIGQSVVPHLAEALRHPSPSRRTGAARALGRFHGDDRAVSALTSALREALSKKDAGLATAASHSLGMLGDDRAVAVLLAAIESPDGTVRTNAIQALGTIGSPRAVAPLKALRDRGVSTMEVASALSMIEGSEQQ